MNALMEVIKKYKKEDSPIGDFCTDTLSILGDDEVVDFADLYDLTTMHTTRYDVIQAFFEFKLMCSLLLSEESGDLPRNINSILDHFTNDKAIETHLGLIA